MGKPSPLIVLGKGTNAGGRTTRWVIRCNECTPDGWFPDTYPTKRAAMKVRADHAREEHGTYYQEE